MGRIWGNWGGSALRGAGAVPAGRALSLVLKAAEEGPGAIGAPRVGAAPPRPAGTRTGVGGGRRGEVVGVLPPAPLAG